MKVMVVVTHLLGSGHLRRAINLSQAFVSAGHQVMLVSGGLPIDTFDVEDFSFEQLPPLCSDGTNFSRLLNVSGEVVDESYLQARASMLKKLVQDLQPQVVITELFPFGRRMLRTEFTGLLESASELPVAPTILSSVRDILAAPSNDKKAQQAESTIEKFYDGVLVHSDPATTPLNISWPVTESIEAKLFYTGYVAQSVAEYKSAQKTAEIVVSAGGGSVGRRVYETAIEAARLSPANQWRILVGGSDAKAEVVRLKSLASGLPVVVEPNRTDFRELLSNASCSVSMCGYNTAIDLLLTGTPGVLVPFDAGGEQEQTLRAESLAERSSYCLLLDKDLTPESLNNAVAKASQSGRFSADRTQFNGALESVRITSRLVQERRQ